jgi:hypothetical protein
MASHLTVGVGELVIEAVPGVLSAACPPHIHGAGCFIGRTGDGRKDQGRERMSGLAEILFLDREAAEPPPEPSPLTGGPKPSLLSLLLLPPPLFSVD